MTVPRNGPLLRIVGSCDGCRHLRRQDKISLAGNMSYTYHCGEPTMLKVHPLGVRYRKIGRRSALPTWCPRLPDARAALGRELVAANERKGATVCRRREEMWERMTQHHRLRTALPSPCTVPFGPLRIDCDCGAPRGVTCADHYAGGPT